MDATNPIRRWMRLVGLLPIVAGCTSTPTEPGYQKPVSELRAQNAADYAAKQAQTAPTVARPQMPSEPAGPLAPLPPSNAVWPSWPSCRTNPRRSVQLPGVLDGIYVG